ncbi:MAG: Rieske 2Fe-2S domain-containing protein, partial [Acidimicrobiaceae bacterium]|nr:Rieske 2Fe-2S domain-containing protein [Acidimicrobiaceae bacterium]
MADDPFTLWHPVASEHDVPYRHVYHGQLLGRELAVWRADDDYVNVWENRCLHRGLRLSIGSNDGTELRCQYHGWRYANRSAGCTYIPAHPADAPARTICNRTFPSVERYGLIWSGEDPVGEPPTVDVLEAGRPFGLRNLPVNASAELAVRHLRDHRFLPSESLGSDPAASIELAEMSVDGAGDYSVALTSRAGGTQSTAVFFVQPVDSGRCVIRGVLASTPPAGEQAAVLRHHAVELNRLVGVMEAEAARLPAPEPMVPVLQQVPLHLAELPEAPSGRQAALRVQVRRKWDTAAGVAAFELVPLTGVLPTFQPGAHIDVHLPNGLVRQYSITNGPGESSHYRIGVKLEPDSTGGSVCLHETVREGDVLAISEPRNNFPLRRDSMR